MTESIHSRPGVGLSSRPRPVGTALVLICGTSSTYRWRSVNASRDCRMGSGKSCHWQISGVGVQARHLSLTLRARVWWVDPWEQAEVYVDGVRIGGPTPLLAGSVLCFGAVQIEAKVDYGTEPSRPEIMPASFPGSIAINLTDDAPTLSGNSQAFDALTVAVAISDLSSEPGFPLADDEPTTIPGPPESVGGEIPRTASSFSRDGLGLATGAGHTLEIPIAQRLKESLVAGPVAADTDPALARGTAFLESARTSRSFRAAIPVAIVPEELPAAEAPVAEVTVVPTGAPTIRSSVEEAVDGGETDCAERTDCEGEPAQPLPLAVWGQSAASTLDAGGARPESSEPLNWTSPHRLRRSAAVLLLLLMLAVGTVSVGLFVRSATEGTERGASAVEAAGPGSPVGSGREQPASAAPAAGRRVEGTADEGRASTVDSPKSRDVSGALNALALGELDHAAALYPALADDGQGRVYRRVASILRAQLRSRQVASGALDSRYRPAPGRMRSNVASGVSP